MELLILLNKFALLGSSRIELLHIYQALHNLWELLSLSIQVLSCSPSSFAGSPYATDSERSRHLQQQQQRSLSLDRVSRSHEHEGS